MATPNYAYEKRQRELAKRRKAEEKRQKKTTGGPDNTSPDDNAADAAAPAVGEASQGTAGTPAQDR